MSNCTDNLKGKMLHAYELGTLSDDELRQFELHLYECEHCFQQIKAFNQPSRLLRHDPEIRTSIRGSAGSTKQWSINKLTKLLLAAAALVVIAIPHFSVAKVCVRASDIAVAAASGDVQQHYCN